MSTQHTNTAGSPLLANARAVLESISDPFYCLDLEWRVVYINQRALALFGMAEEELVGKVMWEAYPLARSSVFYERLTRAAAEQVVVRFEAESPVWKRWFEVHCYPSPAGVSVYLRDIHERKMVEQQNQLHALVLQSMSEGVSVSDENGFIIYTNPAEDRMFGYEPGELIGRHVTALNAYEPPENAAIVERVIADLRTHGRWDGEWRNRRKDGSTFHTRSNIRTLKQDQTSLFVCVQTDITQEKEARVALEEAERYYLRLLASIDDHLVSYDRQWRYVYVNDAAARLLGKRKEELLGHCIWDVFPQAVGNQYYREVHEALATHKTIRSEHHYEPWDTWFENRIYASADGVTVFSSDITKRKRTEQALAVSESRLRIAQLAGGTGTFEWDIERNVNVWSPELCALYGLESEDFEGTYEGWRRRIHPDDADLVDACVRKALSSGSLEMEYRVLLPGGSVRWLYARAQVSFDEHRKPTRMLGVNADVTDRKNAEQARQTAELRARLALESSPIGFTTLEPICDGTGAIVDFRWTYLNQRAATLLNKEVAELTGSQVTHVFPTAWDAPSMFDACVRAFVAGEPAELQVRTLDEGEERWFHNIVAKVDSGIGIWFTDVTERHRAEQVLRESESRFRMLADSAPVLIWVNAVDGCEFVNLEYLRYTGLTFDEVLGNEWLDAVHPEDQDQYFTSYRHAVESQSSFEAQFRFRRADGQFRWLKSRALPRWDPTGRFAGFIGCSADIDDVKRSETLLKETDRRKDEFLAILAHELRNPLAPIRQAAAIAASPAATPIQLQRSREIIERQVSHMALLLDDLLDVSRITRGVLELRKRDVSLEELVQSALEAARPLLERKQHHLVVDLPGEQIKLHVDPVRIAQVLTNLLTNAAKFTGPGGTVTLRSRLEEQELLFYVEDNGIGIGREHLASIFEMFTQVGSALNRAEGGLGIGLALVKGLVQLHAGTVSAQSEGVGRGSRFIVRLPALTIVPGDENPEAAGLRGTSGMALRILVVDDNADAAIMLGVSLELEGHIVRVVHDPIEAFQQIEEFAPEACILDIGMQGMTGYELAARIRERETTSRKLLIALTGWGQAADKQRALEAGFDFHLTKPVQFEELLTTLMKASTEASR